MIQEWEKGASVKIKRINKDSIPLLPCPHVTHSFCLWVTLVYDPGF